MSATAWQIWQVGDARITCIAESANFPVDPSLLFPADREAVRQQEWMQPHYCTPSGDLVMSIQAFIIEAGSRRIVVDTCIGNDKKRHAPMWNNLQGSFLKDLADAGYEPETIDTVVCTHLHVDHVGWNTRWVGDRWVPTFPQARYLFGRIEWEHWHAEAASQRANAQSSEAARMMDADSLLVDSIEPIVQANLHQLVEVDHRLSDEVHLEHTPGHTPGHVTVHVVSRGQHAVITGDMIHHPLQCARPEIGTHVDWDSARSHATRVSFLSGLADRGVLVLGSHFATPSGGHINKHGSHWRFSPR